MTPAELVEAQLTGIERWNQARRTRLDAANGAGPLRDQRTLTSRRTEALRRQTEAMRRRTELSLQASENLLSRTRTVVVVAHRQEWTRRALLGAFRSRRPEADVVEVVDGAEAVGVVVAEQPDLLVLSALLPLMNATEVLPEVRAYSPRTLVVAQAGSLTELEQLQETGAHHAVLGASVDETVEASLDLLDDLPG